MNNANDSFVFRIGALAFALSLFSSLVYYVSSDGVRFLLKAIVTGGRNLMVGA